MAKAFENGRLNLYDYYKIENINADTKMRKSISNAGNEFEIIHEEEEE